MTPTELLGEGKYRIGPHRELRIEITDSQDAKLHKLKVLGKCNKCDVVQIGLEWVLNKNPDEIIQMVEERRKATP